MDLIVTSEGLVTQGEAVFRCALGRGGVSATKREGDGATPGGDFPFRWVYYRPDKLPRPATRLDAVPLRPADGWCDDPADTIHYNRPVRLPHPASAEQLWRADGLYDVVVVLGHNDDPPRPGLGSAIFLHVAAPDYRPTEGCVAVALPDLLRILLNLDPGDRIHIRD